MIVTINQAHVSRYVKGKVRYYKKVRLQAARRVCVGLQIVLSLHQNLI